MLEPLYALALILVVGIVAQWVAWRLRLPSILLLLLFGILVGPLSTLIPGFDRPLLDTQGLLKDLLTPLVALSVGLILYEGGLTLSLREIASSRRTVFSLVSIGAVVTWILSALLAHFVLGMPEQVAVLQGAILVVTGPTVIGPLLRHVRPRGKVGPILKWEGIVIDPIGAILAVLVFEVISIGWVHQGGLQEVAWEIGRSLALTIIVGGGLGVLSAWLLIILIRRYMIPDFLQNPISILFVIGGFALANAVQHESGLVSATVMGIVLANQRAIEIRHIIEFKENLRVLLISTLFIVLGAALEMESITAIGWSELLFVLLLIAVVRPLSVAASTIGTDLTWKQRAFLAWMAPRGIVAAAVSSVFALELGGLAGFAESEEATRLVPITFTVIIGTVAVYGLTASWVARRLDVADQDPQGVLIVGAHRWAREIARALGRLNVPVVLVDSNRENIRAARMEGLRTFGGSILRENLVQELDLTGIGRVLTLTPNDEVNTLALQRFEGIFERAELFQLPPQPTRSEDPLEEKPIEGRQLFSRDATYANLSSRFGAGHVIRATTLSDSFTWKDYRLLYGPKALPMFLITPAGRLTVVAADARLAPEPGHTAVALVNPGELLMPGPAAAPEQPETPGKKKKAARRQAVQEAREARGGPAG